MGKLSILLNNGDGTFQTQIDYPTVDNWWVSVVDLDGDTDLDLVIEDGTAKENQGGEFGARILLNNGDGTFKEGERYFYLPYVGSVDAGDLNGDTYPDLVVRQYPEPNVSVHFGNGDGTFGEPVDYETAAWLHGSVIADLNGDPYPDVATANAQGVVNVLFNKGDGTFQEKIDYELGGEIYTIVAIDMDGDASMDLLVGPTSSGMASLLTNNGDGTFEVTKDYYFKGAWASWFTVYDVDGDGYRELVGASSDSVYVFPFEDGD
jgi:hypothetical protein